MTLRQFMLLVTRHQRQEKRADARAGVTWEDEAKDQTDDEMYENMNKWTIATGGFKPSI